jgi:hypothetical protein
MQADLLFTSELSGVIDEKNPPITGGFFIWTVFVLLLLEVVDFSSRMLAFRGACGEPPRALRL